MHTFDTITQYDKQFDKLFTNINHKGYACSIFALITALKFLHTCDNNQNKHWSTDKKAHEDTVKHAIKITSLYDITDGITFDNLLLLHTNIDINNICATTVELIKNNIIGYEHMFPGSNKRYATIILKNEKYIVVLVDNSGWKVRDCHESIQYDFDNIKDLIKHLSEKYQFSEQINFGDTNANFIDYSHYSSIEFVIIDSKFKSETLSVIALENVKDIFDIPNTSYTLTSADVNYIDKSCDNTNGKKKKKHNYDEKIHNCHDLINFE